MIRTWKGRNERGGVAKSSHYLPYISFTLCILKWPVRRKWSQNSKNGHVVYEWPLTYNARFSWCHTIFRDTIHWEKTVYDIKNTMRIVHRHESNTAIASIRAKAGICELCLSYEIRYRYYIEAWLESFSRGKRVPECTFLSPNWEYWWWS